MAAKSEKTTKKSIMNVFSVDVEGFVESNVQSFSIPDKYIDHPAEDREIQENTEAVLEMLDAAGTRATFFFIGRLARNIPGLVKKVAQAGHEIGCHNYRHLRVFDIERNLFKDKLAEAKKDLEDVAGQPVYGFRAPDFSITKESLWTLDILKELGFLYDSSIYPFGLHDVYGIKDSNPSIHKLPNGLIEFPLTTIELFGKRVPFAGGGYFRLYPLLLTKLLLSKLNKLNRPAMFYIHPYEVGPVIPKVAELSAYRKFRHYYHCKNGHVRLKKLLQTFKFGPAINVLRNTGLCQA